MDADDLEPRKEQPKPKDLELLSKVVYGLIMRGAVLAFSVYEFDAANDLGELVRSIEFSPFSLGALA